MDALSTLLMVIIFVLLVFVLAQAFLSVALSGRDKQLDRVNRQLAEVSDMLSLERGRGADLQQSIAQLNRELATASAARDTLSQQLAALQTQAERASADRDTLRAERDRLAQQLADAALQARSGAARAERLQQDLAASASRTDAAKQETATVATQLAEARRQLGDTTAGSTMHGAACRDAAPDRRARQDGAGGQGHDRGAAVRPCEAGRAEPRARGAARYAGEAGAGRGRAGDDRAAASCRRRDAAWPRRSGSAIRRRAQIALLNQQVDELKAQLASVAMALALTQVQGQEKDTQIANLGQKLNTALAAKVEELQRYRSEFFGKLREVLANRPGIQIVGDRFVFQSEVLFPLGSADLTQAGQNGMTALADHHQGHREADTARHQLGPARRRPHRPAADQGVSGVRHPTGSCRWRAPSPW